MAYIGTKPTIGNFQICDAISVVNGQAAYTMQVGSVNVIPQSANHMIVSLNGTIQKPNSSFTVSGSTITFASNLATGDVIDFIQILGDVLDLGTPSDATVTTAKLAADAVTSAKIADDAISDEHLDPTAITGQTAETSVADDDLVLVSDTSASAALKKMTVSNLVANAGGGKLLQVATDFDSGQITFNSTTYADTGLSISFTPTAANSSLLIFACLQIYTEGNGSYYGSSNMKVLHDGSTVDEVFQSLSDYQSGAFSYFRTHIVRVSSTSNTNARDIKVQLSIGGNANNPNVLYNQYGGKSSLIVQEISA